MRHQFADPAEFDAWLASWRQRLARDGNGASGQPWMGRQQMMRASNPAFIPRNHRVEAALTGALGGDFAPFETLLAVLAKPFQDQPEFADFMLPPRPEEVVRATFCGT